MDGFYVAKIQKLSDKRKGEEDKKEQQAEMASDEVIKDDTVKLEVSNDSKQQGTKKNNKNKKRGKVSGADDRDNDGGEATLPRKKSKVSYAPSNVQLQKSGHKKKKNAKISKPRRMKISGM
jgi:hypothetical protein